MMFTFTMDLGFLVLMILFTVISVMGLLWFSVKQIQRSYERPFDWESTQE
jgi:hypothetical protein